MMSKYLLERLNELILDGMHLLSLSNKPGSIDQHDRWITDVKSFLSVNAPEYLQHILRVAPRFGDRLIEEPYGRASYECIQQQLEVLKLAKGKLIEERESESGKLSQIETDIYDALLEFVPAAACAYKQALLDVADENRLSYRGVAHELREAFRETLDQLAPDEAVQSQPNFKCQMDPNKPTMKQKVLYILNSRGLPQDALKAPEEAVQIVEERVASLCRATYRRSSISAHVASERKEVLQVKHYVNTVFREILSLEA